MITKATSLNNNFIFTKASLIDLDQIMVLIENAKVFQRSMNNYQWDDKYPLESHIREDIENEIAYVLKQEDKVLGYIAMPIIYDEFQSTVRQRYINGLSLNRLVVDINANIKGLGSIMMQNALDYANSIDVWYVVGGTNRSNEGMKRLFTKFGFTNSKVVRITRIKQPVFYEYFKDIKLYK